MATQIECPHCGQGYSVDDETLGRTGRCKRCNRRFTLSQSSQIVDSGRLSATSGGATSATVSPPPSEMDTSRLGRFVIRRRLGSGAFGTVYAAFDPQLEREVALKVPHPAVMDDKRAVDRFLREAKTAARLRHPNIVPVYDAGMDGGRHYIAAAFVEGETLGALIEEGQAWDFRRAAETVLGLAEGLDYAHALGIVHRDVKPANIMLDQRERPHLMDFGLARYQGSEEKLTQDGSVLGTPAYMSPEQARGSEEVTVKSDQYSLGAILYELLCGQTPFSGPPQVVIFNVLNEVPPSPRSVNPRIPRDLETICLKAIARDPDARYENCGELAGDLRRWLNDEPVRARRMRNFERLVRWARHEPKLAAAVFIAVGCLVAGAVVSEVARHGQAEAARVAESERAKAVKARKEADNARARAVGLQETAESAKDEAERHLTESQLDRAISLCEQGDISRGLIWMSYTLEHLPPSARAFERALRANLANWEPHHHDLKLSIGHGTTSVRVAFSPDGKLLATGGSDHMIRFWDVNSGNPVGEPLNQGGQPFDLAFTPDGKTLVSAGGNTNVARRWDVATRQPRGEPMQHGAQIRELDITSDGKLLATGSHDQTARIWEIETGGPVGEPIPHDGPVEVVDFSPDGSTLLVGGLNGTAQLWDVARREKIGEPLRHTNQLSAGAFSPDGKFVVTGGADLVIRMWDAKTGSPLGWPIPLGGQAQSMVFTKDAKGLFVGSSHGVVQQYDVSNGSKIGDPIQHQGDIMSLALNANDRQLAVGAWYDAARVWVKPKSGSLVKRMQTNTRLYNAAFSPDGKTFATAGDEWSVRLVNVESMEQIRKLQPKGSLKEFCVAFSPDGKFLATGSAADKAGRVWNVSTGEAVTPPLLHDAAVTSVAFSPDGKMLSTSSIDKTARLWDASTGKAVGEPLAHDSPVTRVAFTTDGARLLTACHGNQTRLWDVRSGAAVGEPLQHNGAVRAISVDPAGRWVATASDDNSARVWDAHTGKPIGEPLPHRNIVNVVTFSPDGNLLLTAGRDGSARIWDSATGTSLVPPMQHRDEIYSGVFSPDGTMVATGSQGGELRVWDVVTGRPIGPRVENVAAVIAIAFSPGSDLVLTASLDQSVRLCKVMKPVDGEPNRITRWSQVITRLELSEGGIRFLTPDEWKQRRRQLGELGGPPTAAVASTSSR